MELMKAAVFRGPGTIEIEERKKPVARAGEAVIRVTTTTICGTDVHIVKGEYPVKPGLILGHEPVGIIESLGDGLEDDYFVGQRVVVGAITPCGQCFYCLNSAHSQCHGPLGGWGPALGLVAGVAFVSIFMLRNAAGSNVVTSCTATSPDSVCHF